MCTIDAIKLYMLADNASIFAYTPQALQSKLNDLEVYCQIWELKVNVKKSKIMVFKKGRHTKYDFTFSNSTSML